MEKTTNTPYVKTYDKDGNLTNGFNESYFTIGKNRRQRRQKEQRFNNNRGNAQIVVLFNRRYKKILQVEQDLEGNKKYIYHYEFSHSRTNPNEIN